jgi:hypothetical protein
MVNGQKPMLHKRGVIEITTPGKHLIQLGRK